MAIASAAVKAMNEWWWNTIFLAILAKKLLCVFFFPITDCARISFYHASQFERSFFFFLSPSLGNGKSLKSSSVIQ